MSGAHTEEIFGMHYSSQYSSIQHIRYSFLWPLNLEITYSTLGPPVKSNRKIKSIRKKKGRASLQSLAHHVSRVRPIPKHVMNKIMLMTIVELALHASLEQQPTAHFWSLSSQRSFACSQRDCFAHELNTSVTPSLSFVQVLIHLSNPAKQVCKQKVLLPSNFLLPHDLSVPLQVKHFKAAARKHEKKNYPVSLISFVVS